MTTNWTHSFFNFCGRRNAFSSWRNFHQCL